MFSDVAELVTWADGQPVEHGPVTLRLSPPVPHGPDGTKFGYVLMVAVEGSEGTVCFASDTQGPVESASTDWLPAQNPDVVICDGPPTYLPPKLFSREYLVRSQPGRFANRFGPKMGEFEALDPDTFELNQLRPILDRLWYQAGRSNGSPYLSDPEDTSRSG